MSLKSVKKLSVRLNGKEVGILEEKSGKMTFKYSINPQIPLSLTLPYKESAFSHKECHPYFEGLLPENQDIRKALGIKYKISQNNDFALLAAIGHDCAGAVSFHTIETPETENIFLPLSGEPINDNDLEKLIAELPQKPYLGRRLSLAGVQEKTPISIIDGKLCIPDEESPTTHILKPPLKQFKDSVANEYICLKTAQALGLSVPDVEIRKAVTTEYFLIKRFDRIIMNQQIMRLHHEDFAQALGFSSNKKYEVTFKDCLKILMQMDRPAQEKKKFLSMVIFNYLIGNCDAHGKNYSIIYLDNRATLAPVYDVLCSTVYENLDNQMAMKIGKTAMIKEVSRNDWEKLSSIMEVAPSLTFNEIKMQTEILPKALLNVVNQVKSDIGDDILKFANKNCENTKKHLKL